MQEAHFFHPMNESTMATPWYKKLHWQIILGLVLGLLFGILAAAQGWSEFTGDWIAPWGQIFLRLLLLIAVPLVLASLITGVASLSDMKKLSRIGGKTIAIYIGTTVVALCIGLVLVNLMKPETVCRRICEKSWRPPFLIKLKPE